jgi:hypothetical protein
MNLLIIAGFMFPVWEGKGRKYGCMGVWEYGSENTTFN